ncbi:MAG: hypothetical protein K8R67_03690 [Desulfobacteraceae bacterium]|nr:hypothetical protein [Desulfobacteraceae bacterium]
MQFYQILIQKLPELSLFIIAVLAALFMGRYFIYEYKQLLSKYKDSNEYLSSEIHHLRSEVDDLRSNNKKLEESLYDLKRELSIYKSEVESWEQTWKEASDKLKDMISDIGHETKALFSDRDRLKEDLDVVWQAIFRALPEAKDMKKKLDLKRDNMIA